MARSGRLVVSAAVTAGIAGAVTATGAAAGVGVRELLRRQAATARAIIGQPFGEIAPNADKVYRKRYGGPPLQLLLVGDSIAAGLGADRPKGTLGARLAKEIAREIERPVRLTTIARVGSETWMIPEEQLPRLLPSYIPDVAVVVVGGNDVTHRIPVNESIASLVEVIGDLRERGAHVIVGTCPDIGALRPIPQPLRSLGSRASKQLAAAQAEAAQRAGAWVVSLADAVGPFFVTNPEEMFSLDHFHPSELGYRRTAEAMLPSILNALGVVDRVPFGHLAPAMTDDAR